MGHSGNKIRPVVAAQSLQMATLQKSGIPWPLSTPSFVRRRDSDAVESDFPPRDVFRLRHLRSGCQRKQKYYDRFGKSFRRHQESRSGSVREFRWKNADRR
ncbi:hypothetical protein L596_007447 [Steinernema carpocapsae]|uniref:Uncharacterized protein n=1 Tax=Steinernema carpocapsae TaxID=34508 RepID=A0A4U5P9A7_STECR|nr:hypothetical protein L596_007447 [Steinernema carpocapsae]